MTRLILGPILKDLSQIGLDRGHVHLMTAYYSGRALSSLQIGAPAVTFACRLDTNSIDDWVQGFVAPDKLLSCLRELQSRGTRVRLLASPTAHAKLYVGTRGAIIGSSNLTLSGFGGGQEVVTLLRGDRMIRQAAYVARMYAADLLPES